MHFLADGLFSLDLCSGSNSQPAYWGTAAALQGMPPYGRMRSEAAALWGAVRLLVPVEVTVGSLLVCLSSTREQTNQMLYLLK